MFTISRKLLRITQMRKRQGEIINIFKNYMFLEFYQSLIILEIGFCVFFLKVTVHCSNEKKTFPISEGIAMSAPTPLHSDHF